MRRETTRTSSKISTRSTTALLHFVVTKLSILYYSHRKKTRCTYGLGGRPYMLLIRVLIRKPVISRTGPVLLRNGTNIDGLHGRAPHGHRRTDRLQMSRYISVTTPPFISRFLSQVHGLVAAHRSEYSCAQSIRACAVIALTVLKLQES